MSNSSLTLIHQPGCVFETNDFSQRWVAGSAEEGLNINATGPRVNQVLVEFSFILPPLSAEVPGRYPIFTLARGVPSESAGEPDFWFPCTNTDEGTGGTFLHVTYEPSKALLHCGMNAGTPKRKLQWLSLWPASTEQYTGRVLRAFILIAPGGLYPSIEDAEVNQPELFGELQLPRAAASTGFPPWGVAPTGNWWVTSGCAIQPDQGEKSFPPGFGLSDVRIHLADPSDDFAMLPYSGGLDHLASDPEDSGDWPAEFEDEEEPLSELLQGLANQLTGLAGEANDWAGRALGLAEETDELAIRLAEEQEVDETDEAADD